MRSLYNRMLFWTVCSALVLVMMSLLVEAAPSPCTELPTCACDKKTVKGRRRLIINCADRGMDAVPNLNGYMDIDETIDLLLAHNTIVSISNYAFHSINVRKIDVSNNSITSVSSKAFKTLEESLEELILANNTGLREVPAAIKSLTMLKKLDLSNIVLQSIPEGNKNPLANLLELKHLDLSYNTLEIPENTRVYEAMGNLRYLNLAEMGLSSIPSSIIAHTPLLERLIFRRNSLITYSETLSAAVPNLIELDLSKNPISYEQDISLFKGFPNLKILRASGGELLNINRATFSHVPRLTTLTFADLNLEDAHSDSLKAFTKLRHLDIGNNRFNLSKLSFATIQRTLETLNIGSLRLAEYPREILSNMPRLREIHLEGNQITTLERAQFDNLIKKNVKIYLASNSLKTIHQKVIENAPVPVHLFLQDNNITDLIFLNTDACQFNGMTVDVTGNNILCDCATYRTVQQKVIDLIGDCSNPANYNGLKLTYNPRSQTTSTTTVASTAGNMASQYFELAAVSNCGGKSRVNQEYSCSCKTWNDRGGARVCATVGGADRTVQISWTVFIFFNIITIGFSILSTTISR